MGPARPPRQPVTAKRCTAKSKQTGLPCKNRPAPGSNVCRFHGGATPQAKAAAKRRLLAAEATGDLARLGVPVETTPIEALEAMLYEAAGNVVVLRGLVGDLGLEVTGLVYDPDLETFRAPDRDGIAVRTYHQSGIATGEAKPHVLVVMYDDERDRLAKLSEACVKLGLDERRVQLAETQIDRLYQAVNAALRSLPADQADTFRQALAGQLRQLTAG